MVRLLEVLLDHQVVVLVLQMLQEVEVEEVVVVDRVVAVAVMDMEEEAERQVKVIQVEQDFLVEGVLEAVGILNLEDLVVVLTLMEETDFIVHHLHLLDSVIHQDGLLEEELVLEL